MAPLKVRSHRRAKEGAPTAKKSAATAMTSSLEKAAAPRRGKMSAGRVVGDQPLYLQLQRIGGNLTPIQVSQIFRDADAGNIKRLVDLGNEARQKDCHLHAVLGTRELAIQTLPFEVVPYKAPDRKLPKRRDRKIADFVHQAILGITADESNPDLPLTDFAGLIAHLTGGNYFGHATAETMFGKDAGYLVPTGFQIIGQRRFRFSDKTGRLEWYDEGTGISKGVDLLAEYPGKFIQFQPRITGDVAVREGLIRPLMWTALFRNWDIRDWLQLAELAWKPWRTGTYQKGAHSEDIDDLIGILEQMTASGVAVYPETTTVKVEWPNNASVAGKSTHSELASFMGAEMSKAVLGQTLTTEQGDKGARSLGEVHDRVRGDIRDADAKAIASVIRRHLIAPLVRVNFGNAPIPEFKFLTQDAVDLEATSKVVKNLKDAGVRIPAKWVYDTFGIPEPDDDDEVLGETTTDAAAGVNDGQAQKKPENQTDPDEADESDDGGDAADKGT
jgi:phage gp29-like protein